MWDLRWTKWQLDRFLSEFFGLPLSVSFHRGSPYSCFFCWINNRPVSGRRSETWSHPTDCVTPQPEGSSSLSLYGHELTHNLQRTKDYVSNLYIFTPRRQVHKINPLNECQHPEQNRRLHTAARRTESRYVSQKL
jgi:hypothetical protein